MALWKILLGSQHLRLDPSLQVRACYSEGHSSSRMLEEFLGVLKEKENAGFKIICGSE